ncbi:MAG: rRNA maturation RNase YbeY [Gammaproteobacteria bacterium]|nr:rRNA maturation RNase YbeY [Gammaproteobacteria bacterium]
MNVDIQRQTETGPQPDDPDICSWASAAYLGSDDEAEITVRIVDEHESATLNETYRHKTGPTNVLSFPFESPPGVELPLLGDLVICAPVVDKEAKQQGKTSQAHWAHMVVHGSLHLQGYDHIEPDQAEQMEVLEIDILARLGFSNPYESTTEQ